MGAPGASASAQGGPTRRVPRTRRWLLGAITQKGRKGWPGGSQGPGQPPRDRPPPWGGQGPLAPAWGAQCAKVPRTRVWLLGAITQKGLGGGPVGQPGGRAPLPGPCHPTFGWAGPAGLCLGGPTRQSYVNEGVVFRGHHTKVVQESGWGAHKGWLCAL